MRILLTGGAGYVGSHVLVDALAAGHDVCVLDNFVNSSPIALDRVRRISCRDFRVEAIDVRDQRGVSELVQDFVPEVVIHCAGLKAVGESVEDPLKYYDTNVTGALQLLSALRQSPCRAFVFSSSATVYGAPQYVPLDEAHPCRPSNPYGRSKQHIEEMLADLATSDPSWSIALLRYFNPVGAHVSGLIGEDPCGTPNNLMPYVAQVAVGRRKALRVFGADYDTHDGTGVRDYLHVADLANAHLRAVDWVTESPRGCEALNLGTGEGRSVLDVVDVFSEISGQAIDIEVASRRAGDVAISYADPAKAERVLGWRAELSLRAMCQSVWLWQSRNPGGYGTEPTRRSSRTSAVQARRDPPAAPSFGRSTAPERSPA
jgi:UDP-glucose 4-epimerase